MRPLVAAPPAPWDIHPKSIAEWKELVAKVAAPAKTLLPAMREKLGVRLEPATIAGVNVFILTPQTIAPENRDRVFIHFHGGAYVLNPGEPGTREGTLMAAFGRAKVISVDYRTSSDAPYPAALDDCVAVYRELIRLCRRKGSRYSGPRPAARSPWRWSSARDRKDCRYRPPLRQVHRGRI